MLLSSSSFSSFLDQLSTNGQTLPQQPQQQPQSAVKTERQTEQQTAKDPNPYAAQQIGMAMIPEQDMDFSMFTANNDSFNYQPQVFAVFETPEVPPTIETSVLSGKSSNFVGEAFGSDEEKLSLPAPELPSKSFTPELPEKSTEPEQQAVDDEFENDPEFALYHATPSSTSESPVELDTEDFSHVDIFGGIETEKMLARYELVDASEEEQKAALAMARVQRISASLEPVLERLERLCL